MIGGIRIGRRRLGLGLAAASLALAVPAASFAAAIGPGQAARTSLSPAAIAAIDDAARTVLKEGSSPGLVIGVSVGGAAPVIRAYGRADLEHDVPVDADTVFRIGSLTKTFTAAAILLLAEDGKLGLDDPLSKYVPDFPRGGEVTIRQLLTHTSGVHNYTAQKDYFPTLGRQDLTMAQMVDHIAGLDPLYDFDPGTSYTYSNSGYYLLGAIVEKASGLSYPAFLKARILDPLGLKDTAVDDTTALVPDRAHGYTKQDGASGFVNASYIAMSAAGAAGAMRSTARDLLVWQQALLGGRLLKPASLALMLAPGLLKDGRKASTAMTPVDGRAPFDYGFGILTQTDADGRRMMGHGGAIQGFNAFVRTFPDQNVSLVVLANVSGGLTLSVGPKLAEALFDAGLE